MYRIELIPYRYDSSNYSIVTLKLELILLTLPNVNIFLDRWSLKTSFDLRYLTSTRFLPVRPTGLYLKLNMAGWFHSPAGSYLKNSMEFPVNTSYYLPSVVPQVNVFGHCILILFKHYVPLEYGEPLSWYYPPLILFVTLTSHSLNNQPDLLTLLTRLKYIRLRTLPPGNGALER